MIKIENEHLGPIGPAIRGMRNPWNSWEKSDSGWAFEQDETTPDKNVDVELLRYKIGPNDLDLMKRLAKGGPVHAKYRRMITVFVDITAPLYWWKEFDTYKVGTVANSCSTMHTIQAKEFELDDFSHEHLDEGEECFKTISVEPYVVVPFTSEDVLKSTISALNYWRNAYLIALKTEEETGLSAKDIWWQMIQLLPSSYNQKRTVMLNYEVLAGIYQNRNNHKLDEWRVFCEWIEGLPYSELITLMEANMERRYPELSKYEICDDGGYQYDLDREPDDIPASALNRYEVVFDVGRNRYYCFCDAADMNEALAQFFKAHPHITYDMIADHMEV